MEKDVSGFPRNDEDEVSCEMQITNDLASQGPDSLDWSVSGISVASAIDPDRYHTECLSQPLVIPSDAESPEKLTTTSLELRQLEGQFKDLETNLKSISAKSTTPTSSPRRNKVSVTFYRKFHSQSNWIKT